MQYATKSILQWMRMLLMNRYEADAAKTAEGWLYCWSPWWQNILLLFHTLQNVTSCATCSAATTLCPNPATPASGDLNSHPNFQLGGHHTSQCGSSWSIHIPSFKFIGFPVLKIWLIFGHSIYLSGDLDLWPFEVETGVQCHSWHGQPSGLF